MTDDRLLLAIDTASGEAGVALWQSGALLGEVTWHARQSHSVQLLPAADWLIAHLGRDKHQIGALAVCLGPGSYAGMRVGISTAKALAYGLGVPIAGIGRLAAEALPLAEATGGRVVPVQVAGRAELAWAAYRYDAGGLAEVAPPRLIAAAKLTAVLRKGDLVTGDIDRLDAGIVAAIEAKGCRLAPTAGARVTAIARLAAARIEAGDVDDADTLVPLYLRAPAIGPQPPPGGG